MTTPSTLPPPPAGCRWMKYSNAERSTGIAVARLRIQAAAGRFETARSQRVAYIAIPYGYTADADRNAVAERAVCAEYHRMTGAEPRLVRWYMDNGARTLRASIGERIYSDAPYIEVCEDGAGFAAIAVAADDGRLAGMGDGPTIFAAVRRAVDAAMRAKPPGPRAWEGADDDSRAAWAIEPKRGDVKRAREARRIASGVSL